MEVFIEQQLKNLIFPLLCGLIVYGSCGSPEQSPPDATPLETAAPPKTEEIRLDFSGKGTVWRFNGEIQDRFPKDRGCFAFGREGEGWKLEAMGENDFVNLAAGAWSEVEAKKMGMGALVGEGAGGGAWNLAIDGKEDGNPYRLEAEDPGEHFFLRGGKWLLCAKPAPFLYLKFQDKGVKEDDELMIYQEGTGSHFLVPLDKDSLSFRLQAWESEGDAHGAALVNADTDELVLVLEMANKPSSFANDFPVSDVQNAILKRQEAWQGEMKAAIGEKLNWEGTSYSGGLTDVAIEPRELMYWPSEGKLTWGENEVYIEEGKSILLKWKWEDLRLTEETLKN